ncbi:MAG: HAD family hydrolase [Nanobdellota archaeon]
MINTIIFDMDGVIVDSVPLHLGIWREVAQKYGIEIEDKLFDDLNGMDTPHISKRLIEKFSLNTSVDEMSSLKRSISSEKLQKGVNLFPGVKDAIGNLKKLGYRIGLATMTPRIHVESTLGSNILELELDQIITDDDVSNPKPAPDVFLKCAEKLGKEPYQCVVVEDSLNGISAAKAAGMKAVAITNTTSKDKFVQADAIISSMKQLNQDLLEALEARVEITKEE